LFFTSPLNGIEQQSKQYVVLNKEGKTSAQREQRQLRDLLDLLKVLEVVELEELEGVKEWEIEDLGMMQGTLEDLEKLAGLLDN
jgi:hypothetical protein